MPCLQHRRTRLFSSLRTNFLNKVSKRMPRRVFAGAFFLANLLVRDGSFGSNPVVMTHADLRQVYPSNFGREISRCQALERDLIR